MKASELRVGNKLYRGNQIVTVKQLILEDSDILICEEHGLFTLGYTVQPIPLTPEILEKCGFIFRPEGEEAYEQIWMKGNFEIWEHDTGFCHSYINGGDINYLHQLQNLIYSLTNEELNYQP